MLEALGTAATPAVLVTAALALTLVLAVVEEALDVVDVAVTEVPS